MEAATALRPRDEADLAEAVRPVGRTAGNCRRRDATRPGVSRDRRASGDRGAVGHHTL